MQSSKNSWSLRLRKALVFLFILTISSCGGCGKNGKGKKGGKPVSVLLVHGIGGCPEGISNLTDLMEDLNKALVVEVDGKGKKNSNVKIFAPARTNSMQAPLKQQAQEMVDFLEKQGITKKDKVVLVGNSQGGAVVLAMYAMFMRDWENIAIVTIQGANEGTPGMVPNEPGHKALIKQVQNLITGIKNDPMASAHKNEFPTDQEVDNMLRGFLGWQNGTGGADLIPNSLFMQELKKQMPNPVPIPMLLLAGEVQNFPQCIARMISFLMSKQLGPIAKLVPMLAAQPEIASKLNAIRDPWDKLMSNRAPNDLLIPLSSQRGEQLLNGGQVIRKTEVDYVHSNALKGPLFDEVVNFIKDFIKN